MVDDYHICVISIGDEMARKRLWTQPPLLLSFFM